MSKQVMELALEALRQLQPSFLDLEDVVELRTNAISALKEAIKQQGEPVGIIETESNRERRCGPVIWLTDINALPNGTKLYKG